MTPDEQAERLEQAVEAARELLRDLNSAGKDLRKTLRETRELLATDVADRIAAEVETGLATLGAVTEEAMRKAVEKVNHEFDRFGAILLGVDQAEPIEDMVRKVAAMPGGRQVERYETDVTYDMDILEQHP